METKLVCEVCNENEAVGVASVPGVPYSAAYCRGCLEANAHPLHIVISNTACIDGLQNAAPWWRELVADTLRHLNVSEAEFNAKVDADIEEMDRALGIS